MIHRLASIAPWALVLGCASAPTAPHTVPIAKSPSTSVASAPRLPAYCSTSNVTKATSSETIARVEVRGQHRTPVADICRALRTRAGGEIDEAAIRADIRALWDSGFFDDVSVSSDVSPSTGRSLTFLLRERPTVRKVTVVGVSGTDATRIGEIFGKADDLFYPEMLKKSAAHAREEFMADGYRMIGIEYRVDTAPHDTRDIVVDVKKGPMAVVSSIHFTGLVQGKESELAALIETDHGHFNTPGMPYRADTLERDRFMMTSYFYDRGIVSADVGTEEVVLSADGTSLALTIPVTEGPVHRIAKMSCKGDLADSEQKCLELLGAKKGDVFNRSKIVEGIDRIRARQTEKGRGAVVNPETTVDPKTKTLDLKIVIGH